MGGGTGHGPGDFSTCKFDLEYFDNATGLNTFGSLFFLLLIGMVISGNTDFQNMQKAALVERLTFVNHLSTIICFTSFFFHVLHVLGALAHCDHGSLNHLTFLEYMFTCPWMMISFMIVGGPDVRGCHKNRAACLTVLVLLFGFVATLLKAVMLKVTCFGFGCFLFIGLVRIMNLCIEEHSHHSEGLFRQGETKSPYRKLGRKIFFTWLLFPTWWLLGADGLGLITMSDDANAMVKLILNTIAKGAYIFMLWKLKQDCAGYDSMMDMGRPRRCVNIDQDGDSIPMHHDLRQSPQLPSHLHRKLFSQCQESQGIVPAEFIQPEIHGMSRHVSSCSLMGGIDLETGSTCANSRMNSKDSTGKEPSTIQAHQVVSSCRSGSKEPLCRGQDVETPVCRVNSTSSRTSSRSVTLGGHEQVSDPAVVTAIDTIQRMEPSVLRAITSLDALNIMPSTDSCPQQTHALNNMPSTDSCQGSSSTPSTTPH